MRVTSEGIVLTVEEAQLAVDLIREPTASDLEHGRPWRPSALADALDKALAENFPATGGVDA